MPKSSPRTGVLRVVHFLGSLKLALILLGTIALACAVATFCESRFNAKIAQAYIYKAPWFLVWVGVLCVNLFAVTVTRWPWKKRHIGFVVTHYGIIILLIGAMIGSRYGFEGNVTVDKTKAPVGQVTTSRSIVQVQSPADRGLYIMPFDASVTQPSLQRPRRFSVPGTDLQIVAVDVAEHLEAVNRLVDGGTSAPAGVELQLGSATAGRDLSFALVANGKEQSEANLFGMARIQFLWSLPEPSPISQSESQMVFANFQNVVEGNAKASGFLFKLEKDGEMVSVETPSGQRLTYPVKEVLGKSVSLDSATVYFRSFWPDFVMNDGKPSTRSSKLNNPAMLIQVETQKLMVQEAAKGLVLQLGSAGEMPLLAYQLLRDGQVVTRGNVAQGGQFATGWNDWTVKVVKVLSHADVVADLAPQKATPQGVAVPGFLAYLQAKDGTRGEPVWVQSGGITELRVGDRWVRMGYGLQLQSLPFTLRLVDFEVPRYEGTQTPANYISTVEFTDRKTGAQRQDVAKMNHPASWPGGWWALTTGFNYKFSQAEWNPRNLNETTLQVLYDPGWLLKWIGSLGICVGIGIMFYWKPRKVPRNED